ncbi:glutathione S-transferase [Silvimonas iriomotensis]|uniref:Glutathione S-transferase n=1 Tax=Silvimonas iriomotensis TaxID=449662 RepID=A0ABQ2P7J1_9NEIS|nr:glutathione S-transferase [Silvimonas iriomotensis]GGP19931.1 glutathione S-transferase [Silvimonas iriomotensis]
MPSAALPVLYTFRRCPYAIRARLALAASQIPVLHHEVSLRDKPAAMLLISPKGTVPVLQLADGTVLEQSLDIMLWALHQHDPLGWLPGCGWDDAARELVATNDGEFKRNLDRYKYPERYPELDQAGHRQQGEVFLRTLEQRLDGQPWLAGAHAGLVDMAILPFVRQFAHVDKGWFASAPYPQVRTWLDGFLESALFAGVMEKR